MVETRGNGKGGLGRFKRNHSLAEEANTTNSSASNVMTARTNDLFSSHSPSNSINSGDNSDQQQPTHPHNQPNLPHAVESPPTNPTAKSSPNLPHAVELPPTNPTAESSPTNPTAESPPTHPSIVFNAENNSTQPPDACQDIGVEGDVTNFGTSSVSSADGDDHGVDDCVNATTTRVRDEHVVTNVIGPTTTPTKAFIKSLPAPWQPCVEDGWILEDTESVKFQLLEEAEFLDQHKQKSIINTFMNNAASMEKALQ